MSSVATKAAAVEVFGVTCSPAGDANEWVVWVTAGRSHTGYWLRERDGGPDGRAFRLQAFHGSTGIYHVYLAADGSGDWQCDCLDAVYRGHRRPCGCKHARAVKAALAAGCLEPHAGTAPPADAVQTDCSCGRADCLLCGEDPFA